MRILQQNTLSGCRIPTGYFVCYDGQLDILAHHVPWTIIASWIPTRKSVFSPIVTHCDKRPVLICDLCVPKSEKNGGKAMLYDFRRNPDSSPFVFCIRCAKTTHTSAAAVLMETAFRVTSVGLIPYGLCKDCSVGSVPSQNNAAS